jgi:hypothetical protein
MVKFLQLDQQLLMVTSFPQESVLMQVLLISPHISLVDGVRPRVQVGLVILMHMLMVIVCHLK